MRQSGILLHISSLPNKYGIGSFGKEAYNFVDFLHECGQSYWQVLPIGPTSFGDSPYQSFSAFAGNPYFIDLDTLRSEGLLLEGEIKSHKTRKQFIDYGKLYAERFKILRIAFMRFDTNNKEYKRFLYENSNWIDDYGLFMAIKQKYNDVSWQNWDLSLKMRDSSVLFKNREMLNDEITFCQFVQFKFFEQYFKLKEYASKKGIQLIGDIPIYVALDSVDVWANPSSFDLSEKLVPNMVAGVPPDEFSKTGQLWGNPLYNWAELEHHNYSWWVERIHHANKLFDYIRIDHFIGFENYFAIPVNDDTAVNGKWRKGPGIKLFDKLSEKLGEVNIIAEDLGVINDAVEGLLKACGFPNMKVFQFAFDGDANNKYLPHQYSENCVAYTGTHDNNPTSDWFNTLPSDAKIEVSGYVRNSNPNVIVDDIIECILNSRASIVIVPIQDYLGLGKNARMNKPSTLGKNWTWRLSNNMLDDSLKKKILLLTEKTGRLK